MDNTENFDVQAAVKELIDYVGHLANEITEIKTSIMDELLSPIQDEYNKMQYDNALSDFRCKYAEKLEPMADKLKSIEGDDFDVVKKTFDDFNEDNKGYEIDEYVDKKVEVIQAQLDKIGKAFGIEPEDVAEVKVETTDGDEVKAEVEDGEVTAVEAEAEVTAEEATEDVAEETPVEEAAVPEEEAPKEEKEEKKEEPKKPSIAERIKSITH